MNYRERNNINERNTFPHFMYLDTCIFGILLDNPKKQEKLLAFLFDNNLCIAISEAQVVELCAATRKRQAFSTLISEFPSMLIKTGFTIIEEEVLSYPQPRDKRFVLQQLETFIDKEFIENLLSLPELSSARRFQQTDALQMESYLQKFKLNYPPLDSGDYDQEQAEDFTWKITCQWLASTHSNFLKSLTERNQILDSTLFNSIQLFGYVIFYKYYIQGRESERTDFGDLFHLFSIPYCRWAILERDMCNILNQIKDKHNILKETEIRNPDFFK